MANRPVFVCTDKFPWFKKVDITFTWNSGFSLAQKQKNINAIHEGYVTRFPDSPILEVSDKCELELGKQLSMNSLTMKSPDEQLFVVENLFYSAQVFEHGGPYLEFMTDSPQDWKTERRLRLSGPMIGYSLFDIDYPKHPQDIFFDYVYIRALMDNPDLADAIMDYEAFSDIEFNPERSLTCQARAAAMYVSLRKEDQLDQCVDFESFYVLLTNDESYPGPGFKHPESSWLDITPEEEEAMKAQEKEAKKKKEKEEIPEEEKKKEYVLPPRPQVAELPVGTRVFHRRYGNGIVVDAIPVRDDVRLTIEFENEAVGSKKFSWPDILIKGFVTLLDEDE